MGRVTAQVLAALLLLTAFSAIPMGMGSEPDPISRGPVSEHDPIRINSNDEFASMASTKGWTGDGSEGDPFIIEDLSIDGINAGCCLYIGNTTVHFVVRNCTFENASYGQGHVNGPGSKYYGENGITFWMVENGTLENVNCSGNNVHGAWLHLDKGTIIDSTFSMNNISGLWYAGSDTIMDGNSFSNNTAEGLMISSMERGTISDNLFEDNGEEGLFLSYMTDGANVSDNFFRNNGKFDIVLYSAMNVKVSGNDMETGIDVETGGQSTWFTLDIDDTNTLGGKPIRVYKEVMPSELDLDSPLIYLINITDVVIDSYDPVDPVCSMKIVFCDGVKVTQSSFHGSPSEGLSVQYSKNVSVRNCTSFSNKAGFNIKGFFDVIVENCSAYDNAEAGIYVGVSGVRDRMVVKDNEVRNNGGGLGVGQSSKEATCQVIGNLVHDNGDGIGYSSSKGGFSEEVPGVDMIKGNIISNNFEYGLVLSLSHTTYLTMIDENRIEGNGAGLTISDSSGGATLIRNNVISGNIGEGARLILSDDSILHNGEELSCGLFGNTIENNTGYGVFVVASSKGGVPVGGNRIVGNGEDGISFPTMRNGGNNWIRNNVIEHNSGVGISLVSQKNGGYDHQGGNVIENNSIRFNKGLFEEEFVPEKVGGILIVSDHSSGYPILNNTISDNGGTGVKIISSKSGSGNITGNEISRNEGDGIDIYLSSAADRNIRDNMILENRGSGLEFGPGINGYDVYDNTISGNREGIFLNGSKGTMIGRNIFTGNGIGILLDWGDNATVRYNNLSDNDGFGVQINNGNHSTIRENSFFGNNGATDTYDEAHRQACDNGTGNRWYYGTTGNYWDDWRNVSEGEIRTDPYPLDCGAGSVDMYPLRDPPSAGPSNISDHRLRGSILSEEGAPLPGVTVTITELNSGAVVIIVTDDNGNFSQVMRPGPYKIRSSKEGYEPKEVWFEMPSNDEELSIVMAREDDGGPYLLLCLIVLVPLVLLLLLTAIIALVVIKGRKKGGSEE